MEVSGRKGLNEPDNVACNPCKGRGSSKDAKGFCGECEEYMCQSCFDTHIEWKPCRGHTFTDPKKRVEKRENNADLEKCTKHLKELAKFFCPQHEQIGCGDCMILDHKTCKVEYIIDRASTFKDSQEFKELTEGAKRCHRDLKQMITAIKGHKKEITDNNQKFTHEVNMFKMEIIDHVNKLTNAMLKQGDDIMTTDMKNLLNLEKEGESLMTELSLLTKEVESHIDKPNKLFVYSISQKPMLLRLKGELDNILGKNTIDMYEFKREESIKISIKQWKQLGLLHKFERGEQTQMSVSGKSSSPRMSTRCSTINVSPETPSLRTSTRQEKIVFEAPPHNKTKTITLERGSDGLGFTIVGGHGSPQGDLPIFVSSSANKQLKRGDQILTVNGLNLDGCTHDEAVSILKNAKGSVKINVCSDRLQIWFKC